MAHDNFDWWPKHANWANYLAMDANGDFYFHELKPQADGDEWVSDGRTMFAGFHSAIWRNSLTQRPQE